MELSEQTLAKVRGREQDKEQEGNSTGSIPSVCSSLKAIKLPCNGGHRRSENSGFQNFVSGKCRSICVFFAFVHVQDT